MGSRWAAAGPADKKGTTDRPARIATRPETSKPDRPNRIWKNVVMGFMAFFPEDMRIDPGKMESSDGEAGAAGRRNPLPPLWLRNRPRGLRRLRGC
jgi:hypothetical protein